MSQSSASSESPKPSKRCRVCATDDPFNPSATPYTAASEAYIKLYSSDTGISLRDQGNIGPPQLSGPKAPIIFDNLEPYTDSQQKFVTTIEPRVRITRAPKHLFDNPTIFEYVPHIEHTTDPDRTSLFVAILLYNKAIANYTPDHPPPRDLQIPTLYSDVISRFNIELLCDAIEDADVFDPAYSRRAAIEEIFNTRFIKCNLPNNRLGTTIPLQQLEGLAWSIQFINNNDVEADDIIWNEHQFALVAEIDRPVKLTFELKATPNEFVEAWVHTRGKSSHFNIVCLLDQQPLINIEGVAWRYPELDIPIQHQRRLLAVYILNLLPGDIIEVVTSRKDSINTDWHAREFTALVPTTKYKGRHGCLSIIKTRESSAAVEAILYNRMQRSVLEPHPLAFRGQVQYPLNAPRNPVTDPRWFQLQQPRRDNPQVEFQDGTARPYIHWHTFPEHWQVWRPKLVRSGQQYEIDVEDDQPADAVNPQAREYIRRPAAHLLADGERLEDHPVEE